MVRLKPRVLQDITPRLYLLSLLFISLISAISDEDADAPRDADFRILSYKDFLQSQISVFTHGDIKDSVQVTLDTPRNQLLVGARDCIFRLSINDLKQLEVAKWLPSNMTRMICRAKGQTEETCHNFVRVLLVHGANVFSCGTNAYSPKCSWRSVEELNTVKSWIPGVAKCPFDPNYNATAIISQDGDLYTGTAMDITARDPAIYRPLGPSKHLRTVPHNSKWLNEPDFVSTYEIGDFVYFFFREAAVEYINCGKRKYSRVARICKTDKGGNFLLEDNWTTFLKARLNCSLPGDYPFYFDDVQDTFYQEQDELFYTVFTTPINSIPGSAICVYNMSSIHRSFIGPFKYQATSRSAWQRHANRRHQQKCSPKNEAQKRSNIMTQKIMSAQKYQLMDYAVQPVSDTPLKVKMAEQWTRIIVDNVQAKHHMKFAVIFIGTMDGKVKKMAQAANGQMCLIEEISVVPKKNPGPVTNMRLLQEKGIIFVTTKSKLFRLPVQRCDRFKTRVLCMNSMDPYCGWDSFYKACTTSPGGNPHVHYWHQRITSCPKFTHSIDGGWSKWSSWSKCQHIGAHMDTCMCRMRSCDRPRPFNGGHVCQGHSIEVSNCTVHGAWSAWSEWSPCSVSCGPAIKSRRRWCTAPAPSHGGHDCVGASHDEQFCTGSPPCPSLTVTCLKYIKLASGSPIDGDWSMWSLWSACTARCNGGIQRRHRSCDQPRPTSGGRECSGNHEEWRVCNTDACDVRKRSSPWTPWMQTNRSKDGSYFEQRYKFTCRANVETPTMLKTVLRRTDVRYCLPGGTTCHRTENGQQELHSVHGGWSDWSIWAACDVSCGGGKAQRQRSCTAPSHLIGEGRQCVGASFEERACNTHSCQGEWSCWSEFSACSVSCGAGIKTRVRVCQSVPVGHNYTLPCHHGNRHDEACMETVCDDEAIPLERVTSSIHTNEAFTSVHLVIIAVSCFLLGCVLSACILLFCVYHRQRSTKKYNVTNSAACPDYIIESSHIDTTNELKPSQKYHSVNNVNSSHSPNRRRSKLRQSFENIEKERDSSFVFDDYLARNCLLKRTPADGSSTGCFTPWNELDALLHGKEETDKHQSKKDSTDKCNGIQEKLHGYSSLYWPMEQKKTNSFSPNVHYLRSKSISLKKPRCYSATEEPSSECKIQRKSASLKRP